MELKECVLIQATYIVPLLLQQILAYNEFVNTYQSPKSWLCYVENEAS